MSAKDPEMCDHGPAEEKKVTETVSWCRSCGSLIERTPKFEDFSYPDEHWRDF